MASMTVPQKRTISNVKCVMDFVLNWIIKEGGRVSDLVGEEDSLLAGYESVGLNPWVARDGEGTRSKATKVNLFDKHLIFIEVLNNDSSNLPKIWGDFETRLVNILQHVLTCQFCFNCDRGLLRPSSLFNQTTTKHSYSLFVPFFKTNYKFGFFYTKFWVIWMHKRIKLQVLSKLFLLIL